MPLSSQHLKGAKDELYGKLDDLIKGAQRMSPGFFLGDFKARMPSLALSKTIVHRLLELCSYHSVCITNSCANSSAVLWQHPITRTRMEHVFRSVQHTRPCLARQTARCRVDEQWDKEDTRAWCKRFHPLRSLDPRNKWPNRWSCVQLYSAPYILLSPLMSAAHQNWL